jgi:hypothetical protein
MRIPDWLRPRLRLWAIYNELGYIPWKKPKVKKERKRKGNGGVYMGAREAIPFMNNDAKRTISHLLLRPGYMMRDYILRGQHERYLSPITALLVFYSVFTLIVAIVQPKTERKHIGMEISDDIEVRIGTDSTASLRTENLVKTFLLTFRDGAVLLNLDQYPEAVDTPWKASLAAVESDLRSKGIPLFLGSFMLLWISMSLLLRKHGISVSGAAAAAAFVLCQYCIFKFLALLFSFGENANLGLLLMGILLFIDYRQMLGLSKRKALKLTVKTGIVYLLVAGLFYFLAGGGLLLYAYTQV